MENENSNTQTASEVNPPAAAGVDVAALQAKVAELEKQSEGRLRDLQSERTKRQEAEARFAPPAAPTDAGQDELGKVLQPYLAPIAERARVAEAFVAQTVADKALQHISKVTGKSVDAIKTDKDLDNKLTDIVRRYGLQGNNYDVTVRACEIMSLENLKAQDEERKRIASANAGSSLPTGTVTPPVVGVKEYSEEDFSNLSMPEYEKLQNAGSFHQNKEGKIVFTPTPK